ncbi:putative bifunctional diguanylate cyclase/phosphodiesterase [Kineococcus auxinigenes]|uniref:putative bifunctional diguanylate cyclase/phosphodiesterase n=1 Tax=unclassified Kineococcus TaxID=2621656 RepID=UPI003D7E410B
MRAEAPGPEDDLLEFAQRHHLLRPGERAGVVLHDAAGGVVAADATAQRVLGLDLQQLQARTLDDPRWACVDEDGRPVPPRDLPAARALAGGEPVRVVLGVHRRTPDGAGERTWLEVRCEPLLGADGGAPRAVLATVGEVGGERAVRLQLADATRLYRTLAEQAADVVTLLGPDAVIGWISPSARPVLGRHPQDLVGTCLLDLLHPDDRPRAEADLADLLRRGSSARTLRRFTHAQGHLVHLDTSASVVPGERGEPVQLAAILRDVSAQVLAEQERDRAVHRFEVAMRSAGIGMAIADADGRWLEVNQAMADLLGRSVEEVLQLDFRAVTAEADRAADEAAFRRALRGEAERDEAEKRYVRPDGTLVWARRTMVLVRDAQGRPEHFLVQVQDVTDQKRAREQLATLAVTDTLTGLPNRLLLTDRLTHALARAQREGTSVGVLFCDLDLFKQVNDTLGHDAGDELLRQVARRLQHTVREEDTAVRLGGDEFVVVCEDVTGAGPVQRFAERVRRVLQEPYLIDDHELQITVSLDLAVGDGPSAEVLLQQADASMYRAKHSGRARVESVGGGAATDHVALEGELRAALETDELLLHYQPVVSLTSGVLHKREALVRWTHPVHGLLLPDVFLPLAERGRLITALGVWVLRRACRDAARWEDPVTVAVNVSARQLARADFPDQVRHALEEAGLPADRLCLEITESSVLQASETTLTCARRLVELGVTLSLDDFGTGQSSISSLHKLTLQGLKIDRSFIADLPSSPRVEALVEGLIQLGSGMGLEVVAEGVETSEQAAWLATHGCPMGQGFLFGRPGAAA